MEVKQEEEGQVPNNIGITLAGDWVGKCKGLLTRIGNIFGRDKHAFWSIIDPNLIKDYYDVIKDPIFGSQIENKLMNNQYGTPLEFHADVTKMFYNCMLYNPIGDYFRLLAERASADYESAWAASGFAGMSPTSFQGSSGAARGARGAAGGGGAAAIVRSTDEGLKKAHTEEIARLKKAYAEEVLQLKEELSKRDVLLNSLQPFLDAVASQGLLKFSVKRPREE